MKKISEMTLEELQGYALQLEDDKKSLTATIAEKDYQIKEVNEYNRNLQAHNNSLLMRVEQQSDGNESAEKEKEKENKTESCEDFAIRLIQGGNK